MFNKFRAELSELADEIKATPHKAEEVVDSWLLRTRNRKFTVARVALVVFFAFIAGAAFQALVW